MVDLRDVDSLDELVARLNGLRTGGRPSLRDLERRARDAGLPTSVSSLSRLLNGELPKTDQALRYQVEAYVRALGRDPAPWLDRIAELSEPDRTPPEPETTARRSVGLTTLAAAVAGAFIIGIVAGAVGWRLISPPGTGAAAANPDPSPTPPFSPEEGVTRIVSAHSGKCVDPGWDPQSPGLVHQWECFPNLPINQFWKIGGSRSKARIMSVHSSFCLDEVGRKVQQVDNCDANKGWAIKEEGGLYTVRRGSDCLDLEHTMTINGIKTVLRDCDGSRHQLWRLERGIPDISN